MVSIGIGSPSDTSISGGANSLDGKPGGRVGRGVVGVGTPVVRAVVVVGAAATPSYLPGASGPNVGSTATAAYSNPKKIAVRSNCFFNLIPAPPEDATR